MSLLGRSRPRPEDAAGSVLADAEALRQCDREDCATMPTIVPTTLSSKQRGRPHSTVGTAPHGRIPGYGTCAVSSPTAQEGGRRRTATPEA